MENKELQKRQSDQRTTKQVRIDVGLHHLLKVKAAESRMTIRDFLEGYLADILAVEPAKNQLKKVFSNIADKKIKK